jgi:hypothetical protein
MIMFMFQEGTGMQKIIMMIVVYGVFHYAPFLSRKIFPSRK